ncbi:ABC transporter substrate-binding protein [Paenibacillus sp. 1781tsa1]|uniref:ABC transporter substrate-binding protein n=1 Tax=Paenibacillus sp. 1781tsa1 TaxID=2953810 RepID=UPI00209E86D5|nr:ABC transporter substrate-binding protein [Paenibacillus sp. 1781tsa1]MCP1185910.1 ABC transporter substrate-binding protein [Paenibacillus sp. 1781tsa1]
MKRRGTYSIISAAMILLLVLIMAGCGTQADSGSSTGSQTASSSTDAGTASQEETASANASPTKSFTDPTGTKEIPVNPQRIFSISATTQLLALGITPVGGLQYEIDQDYYLKNAASEVEIAGDYPPNMEAVTALQPDLIIASSFVESDVIEQLEKIAPTVIYPWEDNLYDQLRYIGDIVGKKAEAEEWITKHEAKATERKAEMSNLVGEDQTVAAVEIFKDSFQVAGTRNMGFVLHDLLGLKRMPWVQEEVDKSDGFVVYTEPQSLEKLPVITADYLIIKVNDTQPGSTEFYEKMQESSLWKNLPAVKNGNVFIVPHDKWWSYTLFSTDALLDEAVELFKQHNQ